MCLCVCVVDIDFVFAMIVIFVTEKNKQGGNITKKGERLKT